MKKVLVAVFICVVIIYVIAFLQGREISFWPPQIGAKPQDKIQEKGIAKIPTVDFDNDKNQVSRVSNIKERDTDLDSKNEVKAEELIEIIKEQQRLNVRESYGEMAYQCFSDDDLGRFIQAKVPDRVIENLKKDNQFIEVVLAIKKLSSNERQKLLDESLNTYKPTWAQLGKISRDGQTEAGQKAERMISETIVNLVRDLIEQAN